MRNFNGLVVDPFPAGAVKAGENSAGKSNLLESVGLVLDRLFRIPSACSMMKASGTGIPGGFRRASR